MRRLWIGAGVLAVLLALGIGVAVMMHWIHGSIADMLEDAAQAWQEGDRETAVRLAQDATRRWEDWRGVTASFADHNPMDNIEELFSQLPVWAKRTDCDDFAALCRAIARLERSMAQSHLPMPENILAYKSPALCPPDLPRR